jgi:hypothetical protein
MSWVCNTHEKDEKFTHFLFRKEPLDRPRHRGKGSIKFHLKEISASRILPLCLLGLFFDSIDGDCT